MLEALISSKTRIKLLLRLFLNPESKSYLRALASECDESTNAVRIELNRFEEAGMLDSEMIGNKKYYKANKKFSLYNEVRSILLKQTGLNEILDHVIHELGNLKKVYLTGELARGKQSNIVSLVLIGDPDRLFLSELTAKAERLIEKKIQYLCYSEEEAQFLDFENEKYLLLWNE